MIAALVSFAQELVLNAGYPGIVFVAFLENFFPPLPSEAIFPFVGFVASGGKLSLSLVIAAGIAGTFAGALFWYLAGYLLGAANLKAFIARYGGMLRIKLADIERAERWFERYKTPAIFFGRLIPLVRTFISVPAGFVGMSLLPFSFLTIVGSTIWIGALSYAGFTLGERWELITPYFEGYQLAFELLIVGIVVFFVLRWLRRENKRPISEPESQE